MATSKAARGSGFQGQKCQNGSAPRLRNVGFRPHFRLRLDKHLHEKPIRIAQCQIRSPVRSGNLCGRQSLSALFGSCFAHRPGHKVRSSFLQQVCRVPYPARVSLRTRRPCCSPFINFVELQSDNVVSDCVLYGNSNCSTMQAWLVFGDW